MEDEQKLQRLLWHHDCQILEVFDKFVIQKIPHNLYACNDIMVKNNALQLGLSDAEFTNCVSDTEIDEQIKADVATAQYFGGRGTPFSVIVFPDGSTETMSGALPYEAWQQVLNR